MDTNPISTGSKTIHCYQGYQPLKADKVKLIQTQLANAGCINPGFLNAIIYNPNLRNYSFVVKTNCVDAVAARFQRQGYTVRVNAISADDQLPYELQKSKHKLLRLDIAW